MHPLDLHPHDGVARQAWNAIKQPQQPEFSELPIAYRSELLEHAEHALSGEPIEEGDAPFLAFERKVLELTTIPKVPELPVEVQEELAVEVVEDAETEAEVVGIPPEVKEHLELKGQLPNDFPARDKLHEAAINTFGQLAKVEDLTTIDGIGPATAKLIVKRLRTDTKTLNK